MNDKRLVTRLAAGDPEAVAVLYDRYAKPIFSVAYRALGDRSLAEEAVQQTFLQAWRGAGRFEEGRDLAPWLYTIARRVAVDLYRRERRHRVADPLERDIAVLPPSFEAAWATWEVRQALDRLDPEEQEIIRRTHYEGLTHPECAEALGIPVGTVKSRSHRAYRKLAGMLAHVREATA